MPILLPKECELNLTKLFILFKPKIFIRKLLLISLQFAPIILHRKVSSYLYFEFYILETLSKLSLHSTLNRFFELLNVRLSNFRGDLFFRPGTHHSIQDSAESRISVGEEGAIAGIDGRIAKVDDQRDDDDTLRKKC